MNWNKVRATIIIAIIAIANIGLALWTYEAANYAKRANAHANAVNARTIKRLDSIEKISSDTVRKCKLVAVP